MNTTEILEDLKNLTVDDVVYRRFRFPELEIFESDVNSDSQFEQKELNENLGELIDNACVADTFSLLKQAKSTCCKLSAMEEKLRIIEIDLNKSKSRVNTDMKIKNTD
ncbi:hypothetical protein GJ496_006996 [Pomphorhynchus laevis]|nr:hypothetical protein GJ496_006996 [Pomphorhynchus laevis]